MNFDFSEDQKFLKEQARKFLADKSPLAELRKLYTEGGGYSPSLWGGIGEMGWQSTAIPKSYGGLGLSHLELCMIAEELGRALAPVPFASTVYLFAEAVLRYGSEAQKQDLLPKLASGALIGTFARAEGTGPVTAEKIATRLEAGKLAGTKIAVPDGMAADYAVVLARNGGGLQLVLVDLRAANVHRAPVEVIDPSRAHAVITFESARAEPLGLSGDGRSDAEHVLDSAAVLFAFEQIGGADACLTMAREYALERYAFGRPIGSFQAIKHKLADMYVQNELARSNAYFAAWALATGAEELPLAAASARVSAIDAFAYAAKENIQTHGGIGFTFEADCHFYYKRAAMLALQLGSRRTWADKLVTQLELGRVF